RDACALGQGDVLAAQGLDHDEAEAGQGDDDDEEDGGRDDQVGPGAQLGTGDLGQRLAAAADGGGQHQHVLDGAGQADANDDPEQTGHVAVLNGQHGANQRTGAGDGGERSAQE